MTQGTPFIVYALPRSRTFWLSRLLSAGGYQCAHCQARHMRTMQDVQSWLRQDWTGAAETTAAHGWRIVHHLRPDIRALVVRRPVPDVLDSLLRVWPGLDRDEASRRLRRLDRRLDQIERCVPGVMSVRFADLAQEAVCAALFRHCVGVDLPSDHWRLFDSINLQADLPALWRYETAHRRQMQRFAAAVAFETADILRLSRLERQAGEVMLQEEDFATLRRDGEALFARHQLEVGPREGAALRLNVDLIEALEQRGAVQIMTARVAGRLVGYHTSVIGPSLELTNTAIATQGAFYVLPEYRGVGPGLAAAAIAQWRSRGVAEAVMREGTRGSGPRLGALYRRLGAVDHGRLYHMDLMEAA